MALPLLVPRPLEFPDGVTLDAAGGQPALTTLAAALFGDNPAYLAASLRYNAFGARASAYFASTVAPDTLSRSPLSALDEHTAQSYRALLEPLTQAGLTPDMRAARLELLLFLRDKKVCLSDVEMLGILGEDPALVCVVHGFAVDAGADDGYVFPLCKPRKGTAVEMMAASMTFAVGFSHALGRRRSIRLDMDIAPRHY